MAYNIPGIYFFEGDTDLDALRQAFDTLLQRHESLRTVFVDDEEEGQRQRIIPQDQLDFNIAYKDLRSLTDGEAAVRAYVQQQLHQPFSLDQGPLLRVTLYRLQDEQWLLAYVIHHIICDGWSMTIMLKELLQLYEAYRRGAANPLAPLRIQYKDYVHWQQEQLTGTMLETHRDYWKSVFSKGIPRLDLSARNRPPVFSYRGHMLSFMVRPDIVSALLSGTVRQEGTLFTTLLLIVKIMLFKYTGRQAHHGRHFPGRQKPSGPGTPDRALPQQPAAGDRTG